MITVHLSGHLKAYSGGEIEIPLTGEYSTVSAVLDSLWQRYPALHDRVLTETGEIRQHVNIFSNGIDIKRKEGLSTTVKNGDVHIFNAVSGG